VLVRHFDEPGHATTPRSPFRSQHRELDPPSRGREHAGDREGGPPWGGDYTAIAHLEEDASRWARALQYGGGSLQANARAGSATAPSYSDHYADFWSGQRDPQTL